jgi:hypothetical protein
MVVEGNGTVVLAGSFKGQISIGSSILTSTTANADVFVARLNTAGVWTQAAQGSSSGADVVSGLSVDSNGSVVVSGTFAGPIFHLSGNGIPLMLTAQPRNADTDLFIARLKDTGEWGQVIGVPGTAYKMTNSLATNGQHFVFTGYFINTVTFGSTTLSDMSGTGFVAQLSGLLPLATRYTTAPRHFALVPNPAHGSVRLYWPSAQATTSPVLMFDIMGREVRRQSMPTAYSHVVISLADLKPGIYTVRCGDATSKLVVE